MGSTHYMDLLMQNSPWNLLLFMALPVVLAESIAISELYLLWCRDEKHPTLENFRRICGVLAGLAFIGIIIYFIPYVVIPLSQQHGWRTWIDMVAIFSYLASGIPMILIAMLNLGWICKDETSRKKQLCHIIFLSFFLVLSHVAMIFGMVDPSIAGWKQTTHHHQMSDNMDAPQSTADMNPQEHTQPGDMEHGQASPNINQGSYMRDMNNMPANSHESMHHPMQDMHKHDHMSHGDMNQESSLHNMHPDSHMHDMNNMPTNKPESMHHH